MEIQSNSVITNSSGPAIFVRYLELTFTLFASVSGMTYTNSRCGVANTVIPTLTVISGTFLVWKKYFEFQLKYFL